MENEEIINKYVEQYLSLETVHKYEIKEQIKAEILDAKEHKNPDDFCIWSEIEERINRIEYEFFI